MLQSPCVLLPVPALVESEPDSLAAQIRTVDGPVGRKPIALVLTFPGGEEIPITLEFPPQPYIANLSDRLLDDYLWLSDAAIRGDPVAARTLALGLSQCRESFTDQASLDGAVRKLRQERLLTYPPHTGRMPEPLTPTSNVERRVSLLLRRFNYCEGITPDQLEEESLYAKLAADAGDYAGMSHWARILYEAEAANLHFEVQTRLWNLGWIAMTDTLALHYQNKVLDGAFREPDWIRAYAYMQIYDAFNVAVPENVHPVPYSLRVSSTREVLAGIAQHLSAHQQLEAEALAVELLRRNPECCKWLY